MVVCRRYCGEVCSVTWAVEADEAVGAVEVSGAEDSAVAVALVAAGDLVEASVEAVTLAVEARAAVGNEARGLNHG